MLRILLSASLLHADGSKSNPHGLRQKFHILPGANLEDLDLPKRFRIADRFTAAKPTRLRAFSLPVGVKRLTSAAVAAQAKDVRGRWNHPPDPSLVNLQHNHAQPLSDFDA